jgi:hypothetical protein
MLLSMPRGNLEKAQENLTRGNQILNEMGDDPFNKHQHPSEENREAWKRWLKSAEEQVRQVRGFGL